MPVFKNPLQKQFQLLQTRQQRHDHSKEQSLHLAQQEYKQAKLKSS